MRRSSFHLWGKNLITFQVLQHCSVHYFWLLRFLRKPRIHTLVGRRNKALNKTKKVYLHFFMELTFILLVCFLDKNVILFALYCHSSVCAGLQGLYLHNLHWSSRNTWSVLCNMKTITFTNFPCIFFFNTAGYFTFLHRNLCGGEFCLTNIQFSLLSQFMHRINTNRIFYLKETNLLFMQATLKLNTT